MKTFKKEVYRIDRNWFDLTDNRIVGDMYFHFQCSNDTLNPDYKELLQNLINGVKLCEIGEMYELNDPNGFPVYFIQKNTLSLEIEDDDDISRYSNNLYMWDTEELWEDVCMFAVCTKDYASKIGFIKEVERLNLRCSQEYFQL